MARILSQWEEILDGSPVLHFGLHCGHSIRVDRRRMLVEGSQVFMQTIDSMARDHRCIVTEREERQERGAYERYIQSTIPRRNPVGFDPKQLEPLAPKPPEKPKEWKFDRFQLIELE
jgi:hypothetical protein